MSGSRNRWRLAFAVLVAVVMIGSALVVLSSAESTTQFTPTLAVVGSSSPSSASTASSLATGSPAYCASLESTSNDPDYSAFVQHVGVLAHEATAAGLPAADLHLPYTGPYADQTVDGVAMAGSQLTAACEQGARTTSQTDPTGVAYDGTEDLPTGTQHVTLDSNSVAGILTVNSQTHNFYPGSGTPTQWGAQENVVLPNVTLFGSKCPKSPCSATGSGSYAFWVQNVISYDSFNDTISFVDDTWNFTSGSAEMFSSSLASWSPDGSNYTGVWVAYSPYYYSPPPFTVTTYVNTSVNSAGDQVLWYNYSIQNLNHPSLSVSDGTYDYLVFNSQPRTGGPVSLSPPDFEASSSVTHEVTEGYEFDAFIGADDGSNQLMLGTNATMQVQYCDISDCTPNNFAYANVPAAVNYGSQTGEQTVGVAVDYSGSTAYLTGGPLITHGLWNYTGQTGVAPGATQVANAITVSGDPDGPLSTQPYVFVFFENSAYTSQGYQWAPDVSDWYLMPGTYSYEIMLADYVQQNGSIVVGAAPTTLSANLPYNPTMGVYTPLWAFSNGQLQGISTSGSGTVTSQYIPFNNPTTSYFGFTPGNLSSNFYSSDDYHFPAFTGVLFDGTNAYVDLNAPPQFSVTPSVTRGTPTTYYLGIEFFETSNITLAHDTNVRGWPSWEEISFYITVPGAQNPAPQAEVYVWNSTHDLIMSNNFVGTKPTSSSYVAPDELVLYGGTDNYVWGNTFRDPPGVALGTTYGGIGLAENGDLIYNNNFTVDNPIVYLPYNWPNVADCLPQTLGGCANNAPGDGWYYNNLANVLGDTWNVTPQAAGNVVSTVNGFPLSGNVLGPAIATQGGNYYWNYGTSPNNYTTSPYVSRFYYSDWSNIFPLGCGTIQAPGAPCGTAPPVVGAYENGITAGGDYAPYGPTLVFSETGLTGGAQWSVTVGGVPYSTSGSTLLIPEPYGTYSYSVTPPSGWALVSHSSGSLLASGAPTVALTFYSLLTAPASPTVSATALDVDQTLTVSDSIPTTGVAPYSWQWLTSLDGGSFSSTSPCATTGGSGGSSGEALECVATGGTLTIGDTYAFELEVTDSEPTPATQTSQPSSTVIVASALTASTTPTVSTTVLDSDQTLTVSATLPTTGTLPYAWQWLVSEDGGGYVAATQCAINSGTGASAGVTETCTAAGTLVGGNTYSFELEVTDSATSAESATSGVSATVSVGPELTAPSAPGVSATALDQNQALTVTDTIPTTGTAPYTWTWLVSVNGASYGTATKCAVDTGDGASAGDAVTCAIAASALTKGDTYAFELKVTDSASTPETETSAASSTVTVSSSLASPPKPGVNYPALDDNQVLTVTGKLPSSGTAPYSWEWLISVNGGAYTEATVCAPTTGSGGSVGEGVTCSVPGGTLLPGDYYTFELRVTDSATSPETSTSGQNLATVTVATTLVVAVTPSVSATALDQNQALTVTGTIPTTGTGPYSYEWLWSNNGGTYGKASACAVATGSGVAGGTVVTCTIAAGALSNGHTYAFELKVKDSATSKSTAYSLASATVTVSKELGTPSTPSVSSTRLVESQTLTVTGKIPTSGSAPYSWQWLVSVNGGGYVDATQCAVESGTGGAAGATVTCTIAGGTLTVGDTYTFELVITDGATVAETTTSAASKTVTVVS